jgi:hypothetical protein
MAGKEAPLTTPTLDTDKPDDVHIVINNDLIRFIFNSEESTRDADTVDAAPPAR